MKVFLICFLITAFLEIGMRFGYLTIAQYPRRKEYSKGEDIFEAIIWSVIAFFVWRMVF